MTAYFRFSTMDEFSKFQFHNELKVIAWNDAFSENCHNGCLMLYKEWILYTWRRKRESIVLERVFELWTMVRLTKNCIRKFSVEVENICRIFVCIIPHTSDHHFRGERQSIVSLMYYHCITTCNCINGIFVLNFYRFSCLGNVTEHSGTTRCFMWKKCISPRFGIATRFILEA